MTAERGGDQTAHRYYPVAGQALFLVIVLGALYLYLAIFRPRYFDDMKIMSFLMLLIVGFTFFAYALALTFSSGLYLVPFTMIPLMTVIFLDSRTALFVHFVETLICSVIAVVPLEFIFMQYVAGSVAIDSI